MLPGILIPFHHAQGAFLRVVAEGQGDRTFLQAVFIYYSLFYYVNQFIAFWSFYFFHIIGSIGQFFENSQPVCSCRLYGFWFYLAHFFRVISFRTFPVRKDCKFRPFQG